jgi:magnesium chelatase family protein
MPRQKVVVNLAPADIRKEGSAYDLPIALGILAASEQMVTDKLEKFIIMGELALDGKLRPIKGALPIAIEARKQQYKGFVLPKENANEAAIVNNLDVIGVENIQEAIDFFEGKLHIEPLSQIHGTCFTAPSTITKLIFLMYKARKTLNGPGNSRCRRPQCNHDRPSGCR